MQGLRQVRVSFTALVVAIGAWAAPPSLEDMAGIIDKQGKLIEEQGRQIEELKVQLRDLQARQLDQAAVAKGLTVATDMSVDAKKTAEKADRKLILGKHIEGLTLSGDLRVRYEVRNRQREVDNPDNDDRSRWLGRLRLGAVLTSPPEAWELGVGVATGGADGRATNDTWGEDHAFETGDLRLDYAYGKHTWTLAGRPLSATLGQHPSPFVTTDLLWDVDLRPTGVTTQYGTPMGKDYAGPFLTLGLYDVYSGSALGSPNTSENSDVYLAAAQAGYKFCSKPYDLLGALSFWRITDNFDDIDSDTKTAGNQAPADTASPGLWHADQEESFDVLDLLVNTRFTLGALELRPYGDIAYNVGADGPKSQQTIVRGYNRQTNPEHPDDHSLGWLLGLDATYGKLKLGYAYAYVGADAVFGPFRQNEFGSSTGVTDTDIQGHKLSAAWNFTKNFSLGANVYLLERIEGGSGEVGGADYDEGSTYQLEALYKF